MSKRKRDFQEEEVAHGERRKKTKKSGTDKSDADTVGEPPLEADVTRTTAQDGENEATEIAALTQKLTKKEKRELRRKLQNSFQVSKAGDEKVDDAEVAGLAQKTRKQERRRVKREQQGSLQIQKKIDENQDDAQTVSLDVKRAHRPSKRKRVDQKHNKRDSEEPDWIVSDPVGGRMLNLDPIFSRDEKHILLAYHTAVIVYSTATSLPIRHLRTNKGDKMTAFALSSSVESQLYVSTISGRIEKWDWVEGSRMRSWELSSSIYTLATSERTTNDISSYCTVYTADKKGKDPCLISAHRLASGGDDTKTNVKTLFNYEDPISSVKVLESGRFIVATSGSRLILGNTPLPDPPTLQDLVYTWRVVDCPEWITAVDARVSYPERVTKPSKGGRRIIESLDVAVGGLKGSIHIYENLLGNLIRREQPTSKEGSKNIFSRRLHWHRNAVLALKWSQDGNYLVSGGAETVLMLWQLETERKQNLPHLGASINSIVVSPYGSSYGVGLADNSAMILSTSELRPTFSVTGVQVPLRVKDTGVNLPVVPTVDNPTGRPGNVKLVHTPACMSSSRSGNLLSAVPSSTPVTGTSKASTSASYLQTIDIATAHQISRQALTRTNVTNLNMGPESNTIEEPEVTHIQISADGQWLATVDKWLPPKRDVAILAFDQARVAEEQISRLEICLKFWSWNDDGKVWELVSRVENPHASQCRNPYDQGDILDLSSDPSATGFATVGADCMVRMWKPATRRRNGLEVRNKDGRSLTSWHCKNATALESTDLVIREERQGAKLAYGHDGSILVAGLQQKIPLPIYIIDTYSGEIRSIQNGLYSGPLLGLGLVDKYLVTISDDLLVRDLVKDELQYGIGLHACGSSLGERIAKSHLAVDSQHGLFAIALPELQQTTRNSSRQRSQLAIFDPVDAIPLFRSYVPTVITTLLPSAGRKGFVAIDSLAEIRAFVPKLSLPSLPLMQSGEEKVLSRGLGDIFGGDRRAEALGDGPKQEVGFLDPNFKNLSNIGEDDAVFVSQKRLAEVFDANPGSALPPVMDLFERIARLCNGRVAS